MNDLCSALMPLTYPNAHTWHLATTRFLARAIRELVHERLVVPTTQALANGRMLLTIVADSGRNSVANIVAISEAKSDVETDNKIDPRAPSIQWTCTGVERMLDHWSIDPESIRRLERGVEVPFEAADFFIDLREAIGVEPFTLMRFLEESAQTVLGQALAIARGRPSAAALARSSHQTIESAMEGHPWVIASNGRLGFSIRDTQRFAPEHGQPARLLWIAAHRRLASFYAIEGLTASAFFAQELGPAAVKRFCSELLRHDLDQALYVWLPVHEWQWEERIAIHFASAIAKCELVLLGYGDDEYLAQQSIRTYYNCTQSQRCYVKTALSILNTFQIRGLDPRKLAKAPQVTAWLRSTLGSDPWLNGRGFAMLGEIACVAVRHPTYERVDDGPYHYREFLGALWRESPVGLVTSDERVMTMAALLYVDDQGRSFVGEMIAQAQVDAEVWLERFFLAYLSPILHCFFAHEVFFVAHGENTILVTQNGLVTRVIFKDLVEEVQVSARVHATLPEGLRELLYHLPDALVPLFVLTDIFDGFFRYLSDVLEHRLGYPQTRFWRQVAQVIATYEREHPELAHAFRRYNLWEPTFPLFAINKYRLVYHGYAEAARNVHDLAPRFDGILTNPIAAFSQSVRGLTAKCTASVHTIKIIADQTSQAKAPKER